MMILILYNTIQKCLNVMCCISLNMYLFQSLLDRNLHNKDPNIFAFHTFALKYCLITVWHVKAVQDDISTKTVPISYFYIIWWDVKKLVRLCDWPLSLVKLFGAFFSFYYFLFLTKTKGLLLFYCFHILSILQEKNWFFLTFVLLYEFYKN